MVSRRHHETKEKMRQCAKEEAFRSNKQKLCQRKAPFVQMSMCVLTGRLAWGIRGMC